jgi:hypothetical protein
VEQSQIKTTIHMFRTKSNGLPVKGFCRDSLSLAVQIQGSVKKIVRIAGAWPAIFGGLPVCLHRA